VSFFPPSQTITFDAALRDLGDKNWKARARAAQALGDLGDPAERRRAIDALLGALDDDRADVRAEACGSLGTLGEAADAPRLVPALVKRLDDGAPTVRQHAAIALGSLGAEDGFAPLADALRDGPADLRFQAATSLAEIDPARAFVPLVAALDDKDAQVVSAAALSLGAIGDPRALPELAARVDHTDAGARFDVGYALAELGDPRGRAALVIALVDEHRAWDAVSAIAKLGTPDDLDLLARTIPVKATPVEAAVLAAGRVLALAPDSPHTDDARKALLAALANRKTHVRSLAVEQLGEVGGAWAVAPLTKLAASRKGGELLDTIAAALQRIEGRP
jgi:HEAT repeat protein